jgi:hypothetical protein
VVDVGADGECGTLLNVLGERQLEARIVRVAPVYVAIVALRYARGVGLPPSRKREGQPGVDQVRRTPYWSEEEQS